MPDDYVQSNAVLLFGGQAHERYGDPEIQGGKIAVVATNNNKVQKPPNSLNRMHASRPKQVAYNQRALKAEERVAGMNCDLADFLAEMSPDPAEPVIICVDARESTKRHEQHLGGQLWMQGNRTMTATNV
jgi:hypothetical protein